VTAAFLSKRKGRRSIEEKKGRLLISCQQRIEDITWPSGHGEKIKCLTNLTLDPGGGKSIKKGISKDGGVMGEEEGYSNGGCLLLTSEAPAGEVERVDYWRGSRGGGTAFGRERRVAKL